MVCFQLHQNPDNRTTYTVQQRVVNSLGLNNTLRYPLEENMEYVVRVRNITSVYACGVGSIIPKVVHEVPPPPPPPPPPPVGVCFQPNW